MDSIKPDVNNRKLVFQLAWARLLTRSLLQKYLTSQQEPFFRAGLGLTDRTNKVTIGHCTPEHGNCCGQLRASWKDLHRNGTKSDTPVMAKMSEIIASRHIGMYTLRAGC
jgi:hypothetical protein